MSVFTLSHYSRDYPEESEVLGVYSSFENIVQKLINIWDLHKDDENDPYIIRDGGYGAVMNKTRDQFISFVYRENGKVYDNWGDLYTIQEFIMEKGPVKRRHNCGRRKPKDYWS
jgi:hypothetical protein